MKIHMGVIMKLNYKHTMYASFTGYIVQAIINNFIPLLFLTFQSSYNIPISKITFLVTFNFGFQLVIDFLSAGFIDKIGYRTSVIIAHVCSAIGLLSLTILPEIFNDPFIGLLLLSLIHIYQYLLLELAEVVVDLEAVQEVREEVQEVMARVLELKV